MESLSRVQHSLNKRSMQPLGLVACACVAAIVTVRLLADRFDFAVANIVTISLATLVWILLIVAALRSTAPRYAWRALLAVPLLAAAVFLSVFRFERLDGDLQPVFRSRWSPQPVLPEVQEPVVATTTNTPVGSSDTEPPAPASDARSSLFAARTTDFPQFLGPSRDARLPDIQLSSNWIANPPAIQWKQPIGPGWSGFAIQGDVGVTMEQRGDEEWISAYNLLDGNLLWRYGIPGQHTNLMGGTGPRSTPTIADNKVYAASAVSRTVCLDLQTGAEIWSRELLDMVNVTQAGFEGEVAWGRSASPLIVDSMVVFPVGGAGTNTVTLTALDRTTGEPLWQSGSDQISYSSPSLASLAGERQILLISESQLASYATSDGQQLWRFPWPGSSSGAASVSQPIAIDEQHVLVTKGYGEGASLLKIDRQGDNWEVTRQWSNHSVLRTKFTSCVVKAGFAYGLSDGILECIDLSDGKKQWKQGRYRQGQLLLVGEHLLITAEDGQIVLVQAAPDRFQELGRMQAIGDVTWNTAALSGNRLVVRNSNEAACVLLPLGSGTK